MNPNDQKNNLFEEDSNLQTGTPMISGLPENFQTPQNSPYITNNPNPQPEIEQMNIDPFSPPEYESVNPVPETPQGENLPNNEADFADIQDEEVANWQAKDIIVGEKSKTWYIIFSIVVLALMVGAWLIGSWSFSLLIAVSALAIVIVRNDKRGSNDVSYSLSRRGFYINGKLHEFEQFKYFGILKDDVNFSIVFIPKKRLSPSVSLYFPEENGEQIVDIIGARLPMEEVHLDMIDKIVRKLKL